MFPQLASGALIPRPRNERAASESTASAKTKVACTRKGAITLGTICSHTMRAVEAPCTRRASTKGSSLTTIARERTMRAMLGV